MYNMFCISIIIYLRWLFGNILIGIDLVVMNLEIRLRYIFISIFILILIWIGIDSFYVYNV